MCSFLGPYISSCDPEIRGPGGETARSRQDPRDVPLSATPRGAESDQLSESPTRQSCIRVAGAAYPSQRQESCLSESRTDAWRDGITDERVMSLSHTLRPSHHRFFSAQRPADSRPDGVGVNIRVIRVTTQRSCHPGPNRRVTRSRMLQVALRRPSRVRPAPRRRRGSRSSPALPPPGVCVCVCARARARARVCTRHIPPAHVLYSHPLNSSCPSPAHPCAPPRVTAAAGWAPVCLRRCRL